MRVRKRTADISLRDELCSEDSDGIEPEAVFDVVEHLSGGDHVECVQVPNCDICHDVHQHMLLDVSWTRVEREAALDSLPALSAK